MQSFEDTDDSSHGNGARRRLLNVKQSHIASQTFDGELQLASGHELLTESNELHKELQSRTKQVRSSDVLTGLNPVTPLDGSRMSSNHELKQVIAKYVPGLVNKQLYRKSSLRHNHVNSHTLQQRQMSQVQHGMSLIRMLGDDMVHADANHRATRVTHKWDTILMQVRVILQMLGQLLGKQMKLR